MENIDAKFSSAKARKPRFIQGRAKTLSDTPKRTYVHAEMVTTAAVELLPKYHQILLRSVAQLIISNIII